MPVSKADELKVFPCLSTLVLKEYHQGLIEYLDNTPFITELTYKGKGQRSLDFRGTSLRKLLIDLTEIDELWLNDEMEQLYLLNDTISPCVIHARDNGANLLLQYRKIFHPYPELSNLNSLHGIEINEVDMNDIFSVYPNLKELWLWGNPGISETSRYSKVLGTLKFSQRGIFLASVQRIFLCQNGWNI